jgi:hypothetical protein
MRVLGSRQLAMLTLGMSVPLLFSFQLKAPPAFLQGLPFILIWTWAVVSTITVPVLTGLEIIACVFHLRRRHKGRPRQRSLSMQRLSSSRSWPKSCACQREEAELDGGSSPCLGAHLEVPHKPSGYKPANVCSPNKAEQSRSQPPP